METNRKRLEALIYWRDPKLSGAVFGSVLIVLLSLAYYSLISVVANLGLIVLGLTVGFRVYKDILQAVQKTPQVHPLQDLLSVDISLPHDKVQHAVDCGLSHFNACLLELRRLFLVESLVDSLKFAVVLWVFSYVGAWFNGLTLVILAFIGLFTLPKVYESNKAQIDQYVALAQQKFYEIANKVNDALPAALKRPASAKKD